MVLQQYVRPEVLATSTEEELAEEAAVCLDYGIPTEPPPGGTPS